jgi:hypothetical protein
MITAIFIMMTVTMAHVAVVVVVGGTTRPGGKKAGRATVHV